MGFYVKISANKCFRKIAKWNTYLFLFKTFIYCTKTLVMNAEYIYNCNVFLIRKICCKFKYYLP